MPPAPRRSSTSPGPGSGTSAASTRRSSLAWMRQASMASPSSVQRVPAGGKALVGLVQVPAHRGARAGGIARGDRLQHGAMLGHRRGPQRRRIVMVLELRVERTGALLPQHLDDGDQRAVPRRFGDAQVEEPVAGERLTVVAQLARHLLERIRDALDLRLLRDLRSLRRAFALDERAGAEQLERTRLGLHPRRRAVALPAVRAEHVDARADAHLDQPLDLERDQRLANGRPRYAELPREIALGRKPRSRPELARGDQRADLVRDLPVQAAGLDALERHDKTRSSWRDTGRAGTSPSMPADACPKANSRPAIGQVALPVTAAIRALGDARAAWLGCAIASRPRRSRAATQAWLAPVPEA